MDEILRGCQYHDKETLEEFFCNLSQNAQYSQICRDKVVALEPYLKQYRTCLVKDLAIKNETRVIINE
jgi:hypothetical protein